MAVDDFSWKRFKVNEGIERVLHNTSLKNDEMVKNLVTLREERSRLHKYINEAEELLKSFSDDDKNVIKKEIDKARRKLAKIKIPLELAEYRISAFYERPISGIKPIVSFLQHGNMLESEKFLKEYKMMTYTPIEEVYKKISHKMDEFIEKHPSVNHIIEFMKFIQ